MEHIDLSSLTLDELIELDRDIKHELDRRRNEERATLLHQAHELAKRLGISLDELLKPSKRHRATPAAKYRNPDNPSETWTGRGKKPQWVHSKLETGATLESLEITEATLADTPDDTARGRKESIRPE